MTDEGSEEEPKDPKDDIFSPVKPVGCGRYYEHGDPRRWRAMILYGLAYMAAVFNWSIWTSVSPCAMSAFPNWTPKQIAILNNWGYICFFIFMFPACYVINTQGFRTVMVLSVSLCVLGVSFYLLTVDKYYWLLVNIGAVLNSIGGVMLLPLGLPLSSTWFKSNERTFALSIGTMMGRMGIGLSNLASAFIKGPPDGAEITTQLRENVRSEILSVSYIGFLSELILLFIVVTYFPVRPKTPPTKSAYERPAYQHMTFAEGILGLLDGNFFLLSLSEALLLGSVLPWLSQLPSVNRSLNITQNEITAIGFRIILVSCFLSLTLSKVADKFPRNKRGILITFILFANVMFEACLFMTLGILTFSKGAFSLAVVAGIATALSLQAIFLDLGAESTYPLPEATVVGYMMTLENAVLLIVYLHLQLSARTDITWMSYILVTFGLTSLFCLLIYCCKYKRLNVDQEM